MTDDEQAPSIFETSPHNGKWQGKLRVRTLPPATFGEDLRSDAKLKAAKGHAVQSRLSALKRLGLLNRKGGTPRTSHKRKDTGNGLTVAEDKPTMEEP